MLPNHWLHKFKHRVLQQDDTKCWPWLGSLDKDGYGTCQVNSKVFKAHRVALELKLGRDIKFGYEVMHSCDNRACCNPAHLSEGTHTQNMRDCRQKNRLYIKPSILTDSDKIKAKLMRESGYTLKEIAKTFDISYGATRRALGLSV